MVVEMCKVRSVERRSARLPTRARTPVHEAGDRCAAGRWSRTALRWRGVVPERGGCGVAARRVKDEEVGVDDTLVVVGAVYVAWERRARNVRRVRSTSEECASGEMDERGMCVG